MTLLLSKGRKMIINDVVLLHGWGLNKAVWLDYLASLELRLPNIRFHLIDIPGYGELSHKDSSSDIQEITQECLNQAPEKALWVGWSLGGMIALQAALTDLEGKSGNRVQALQLINVAPKFVQSSDWASGVDIAIFDRFCAELAKDYERALGTFLLLQAGAAKGARALARDAQSAIEQYRRPSELTLRRGIECLASVDLRGRIESLSLPTQVVSGTLDRVTMPESCRLLSQMMGAQLVEIKAGHAPFLTNIEFMLDNFDSFVNQVEIGNAP